MSFQSLLPPRTYDVGIVLSNVKRPTQLCLPHILVKLYVHLYLSVCVWDGIVYAITDCQELQASSKQTHFDKVHCFHLVIKYKSVRLREEILIVQITRE